MQHRKLSQEEACKLFQTTFLLISQQNLAEKQKNLKSKNNQHPSSPESSLKSPKKISSRSSKPENPSFKSVEQQINPEKSPEKNVYMTSHKFSVDKQQSASEGISISIDSQFKLIQNGENNSQFNNQQPNIPSKHHHKSEEMQPENHQSQSQMRQGDIQKLYLESQIKQLKRDLEIKSRGKICKSQEINHKTGQVTGYNFYCKNDSDCPFNCSLDYAGKRNSKNQKLYRLVEKCQNHLKSCIEQQQQIHFIKLTKLIDEMEKPIIKMLSQNVQMKPKEILTAVAESLGEESHKFIYKGLTSKNYHKAAKKYFDNLIYKVKNSIGAL